MTDDASASRLELIGVILLSITAILTAWTAFQSSKWGRCDVDLVRAGIHGSHRGGAVRRSGQPDDLGAGNPVHAVVPGRRRGDQKLADFYEEQFRSR